MPSDDAATSLSFTILPESEHQRFRLLELPPELLELVTSDKLSSLELKSKQESDGTAEDAQAVLCTPNRTYQIRQVSTSNSVYLIQAGGAADPSLNDADARVYAVAKCDSTLELKAAPKQSAVSFIKNALPIYSSTGNYGSSRVDSKAELFSHIPLSQAECEESWVDLACFESISPAGCYMPHAKVRTQIWGEALTAAVADAANIQDPFLAGDIPPFALDLRESWPLELLAAVFASLSGTTPGGNLSIGEDKCVRVVGLTVLEDRSEGKAISKSGFLRAWKDALPERWREQCDFAILKDCSSLQESSNTITWTGYREAANTTADAAADAKSTIGAKRKWHEKFRRQKNTT